MKIAQVTPLYEAVPPRLYGGTERVVAHLTDALVDLGHDVTLFASADAETRARLVPVRDQAIRLDPAPLKSDLAAHMTLLSEVLKRADDFDVIHFHTDMVHFPFFARYADKTITTLHGRLDLKDLPEVYERWSEFGLVSISDDQRRPLPFANWQATVHHGMPAELYRFSATSQGYLAFLGRISPEKRPDRAIEIATRLNKPLKIAAKVDAADKVYWETVIKPMIDGNPLIEFVGEIGDHQKSAFLGGALHARVAMRSRRRRGASIRGPRSPRFNDWLDQSRADVALLTTDLATGPYPYAGVPWFSTPFGRDGIITAWQMLWLDPSLAKGVLTYLAMRQATEVSAFQDSAPGKIMHETRGGEMSALREVPFGLYYGGVDTTCLFVALAGAYLKRTGDLETIRALWPNLIAAVGWMTDYGDFNGDGLISYQRGAETGLANQGWKDSEDSIFHADGRFPKGPIALLEVQGYAFAAWEAMAAMARVLGDGREAEWTGRAGQVRALVEDRFWMEDEQFYAIALDGDGKQCRAIGSNAGHLLFTGLPSLERARLVTKRMLCAEFRSGWGLRTLATGQARFNPMSYHNGSVWPHDTALAAAGMAQYGERRAVALLLGEIYAAATHFQLRLPELFCGFERTTGEPPVAYPVACLPQAWAAGSVFLMLQAALGVRIDAAAGVVEIERPLLPSGIERLHISNLRVGDGIVDLAFQQMGTHTVVVPRRREGSVSIRTLG